MDLSKLMAGLGLGAGDKGGNSDLMKQAENMWKMLDDLAENNPDGYQKFVSSNIEQGKQVIQDEHEKEVKDYTRTLEKDAFKTTILVAFELNPKVDTAELNAPVSVMIDQKLAGSKKLKGAILLSIFSVKDQTSTIPPSIDHFHVKLSSGEIGGSVCVAFSPADAAGLISSPMTQGARVALGKTLGRLDSIIPFEVLKQQKDSKVADKDCLDPNAYTCLMKPNELKRLPGYADCTGNKKMPASMVLDSLLMEAKQKVRAADVGVC